VRGCRRGQFSHLIAHFVWQPLNDAPIAPTRFRFAPAAVPSSRASPFIVDWRESKRNERKAKLRKGKERKGFGSHARTDGQNRQTNGRGPDKRFARVALASSLPFYCCILSLSEKSRHVAAHACCVVVCPHRNCRCCILVHFSGVVPSSARFRFLFRLLSFSFARSPQVSSLLLILRTFFSCLPPHSPAHPSPSRPLLTRNAIGVGPQRGGAYYWNPKSKAFVRDLIDLMGRFVMMHGAMCEAGEIKKVDSGSSL
jgi:hypothetical protein